MSTDVKLAIHATRIALMHLERAIEKDNQDSAFRALKDAEFCLEHVSEFIKARSVAMAKAKEPV